MTRKNNNVTKICQKCLNPERLQAFWVFFYCHSRSDRREQHSKNGGAPWLPEPCIENNDEHSPAQTTRIGSKISTKTPQNTPIYTKTAIGLCYASVRTQKRAVSVRKNNKRKRRRKPIAAFPRLSRHLELLPSSESFAFDWRYFHLHHTQVMWKSHPFWYV